MGRLELGFASFGLVLKAGWRVGTVISPLLKGLCDAKRVGEAMDILLRRISEFGCTPDVVSYTTVLKGSRPVEDHRTNSSQPQIPG
jgi:pentatricopeptide repeat protein